MPIDQVTLMKAVDSEQSKITEMGFCGSMANMWLRATLLGGIQDHLDHLEKIGNGSASAQEKEEFISNLRWHQQNESAAQTGLFYGQHDLENIFALSKANDAPDVVETDKFAYAYRSKDELAAVLKEHITQGIGFRVTNDAHALAMYKHPNGWIYIYDPNTSRKEQIGFQANDDGYQRLASFIENRLYDYIGIKTNNNIALQINGVKLFNKRPDESAQKYNARLQEERASCQKEIFTQNKRSLQQLLLARLKSVPIDQRGSNDLFSLNTKLDFGLNRLQQSI